jgi:aldehyde:ferredoxin oxidoreductase
MGSKNLRAVAALGTQKIPLHDPEYLRQTAKEYATTFKDVDLGKCLYVYGTTAFCQLLSVGGGLPVNNFRRSALEDPTPVSRDTYNEVLLKERRGCCVCPIRYNAGDRGGPSEVRCGFPLAGQYETMASSGTNLNHLDLNGPKGSGSATATVIPSPWGMTLAFAFECSRRIIAQGRHRRDGASFRRCGSDDSALQMTHHHQGLK